MCVSDVIIYVCVCVVCMGYVCVVCMGYVCVVLYGVCYSISNPPSMCIITAHVCNLLQFFLNESLHFFNQMPRCSCYSRPDWWGRVGSVLTWDWWGRVGSVLTWDWQVQVEVTALGQLMQALECPGWPVYPQVQVSGNRMVGIYYGWSARPCN